MCATAGSHLFQMGTKNIGRWLSRVVSGIIFFLLNFALEFAAWACHPGNTATGNGSVIPWAMASFPVFTLLGRAFGTNFFWPLLFLNSLLWTFLLTIFFRRLAGACGMTAKNDAL